MKVRVRLRELLDDTRKALKLYALGALLFFIGLGIIQGSVRLLAPSLRQESYVLLGLIVGGSGFLIAMFAQVLLILHRFIHMGKGER